MKIENCKLQIESVERMAWLTTEHISNFKFQISNLKFQISNLKFQISNLNPVPSSSAAQPQCQTVALPQS